MNQCPYCGRFVKDVQAVKNGMDEIVEVTAVCKRDGIVHPTDWYADQFDFSEDSL